VDGMAYDPKLDLLYVGVGNGRYTRVSCAARAALTIYTSPRFLLWTDARAGWPGTTRPPREISGISTPIRNDSCRSGHRGRTRQVLMQASKNDSSMSSIGALENWSRRSLRPVTWASTLIWRAGVRWRADKATIRIDRSWFFHRPPAGTIGSDGIQSPDSLSIFLPSRPVPCTGCRNVHLSMPEASQHSRLVRVAGAECR